MNSRSRFALVWPALFLISVFLTIAAARGVWASHTDTHVVWAVNFGDVRVPPRTWTRMPWDAVVVNTLHDASVDSKGTWTLPEGIYTLMVELAWPNIHGLAAHRRKARIVAGSYPVASHETNSAVTCGCPDDELPQTFLVEMQPGQSDGMSLWVEVWHNAPQVLTLKRYGMEAPSFMLYRLGNL
jgi:hypothetical protein